MIVEQNNHFPHKLWHWFLTCMPDMGGGLVATPLWLPDGSHNISSGHCKVTHKQI